MAPDRSPRRRRLRRFLRSLPARTVLTVCFCLGVVALALAVIPFDTAGDGGAVLRCGPPFYEVVVPADPSFDVPENAGCATPARLRLALGAGLFVVAILAAVLTEARGRSQAAERQRAWLADDRGRRRRRAQRARRERRAAARGEGGNGDRVGDRGDASMTSSR